MKVNVLSVILLISLFSAACGPVVLSGSAGGSQSQSLPQNKSGDSTPDPAPAAAQETEVPPEDNPPAPTQVPPEQIAFGPNLDNFPTGYNPLTGQPVADPSLLKLPAVLISISHFPASARPLSGLSFAPFVMEMYITEGMTRFLAAYYGDFPFTYGQLDGGCTPRMEPFEAKENFVGDWVWLDSNANGQQDTGELGIGGICSSLLDADTQAVLETTSTDTNGFYGFNIETNKSYIVQFVAPDGMSFTTQYTAEYATKDSNANPVNGKTDPFVLEKSVDHDLDAGLIMNDPSLFSIDPVTWMPVGENYTSGVDTFVGPVRSGRLPYAYVRDFFQSSCLVYAGSAPELANALKGCAMAFGNDDGGAGSMLDVTRLKKIAEQNSTETQQFNYSGNLFDATPPSGGIPAANLKVFYSYLNQSKWIYDPLMESWLRYHDKAEGSGNFYPDTDRLTGRQVDFENVIVLIADHEAITSTIIDINLTLGQTGDAYLFRDGQMYKIKWTTVAEEYEKTTGLRRPLRFTDAAGNPFPLKPGSTWIHVMTPASYLQEESPTHWLARFYAPVGSK